MIKLPLILLVLVFTAISAYSQIRYQAKVEAGFISFRDIAVNYDPGPGWRGFYLADDGVDFNVINGFRLNPHFYTGIGVAYANYSGISGVNAFVDLEYIVLKTKLSPLLGLKLGYDHVWNQYDGGHGSGLSEACAGINYTFNQNLDVFLKSGIRVMHDAFFVPIRLGVRF